MADSIVINESILIFQYIFIGDDTEVREILLQFDTPAVWSVYTPLRTRLKL